MLTYFYITQTMAHIPALSIGPNFDNGSVQAKFQNSWFT